MDIEKLIERVKAEAAKHETVLEEPSRGAARTLPRREPTPEKEPVYVAADGCIEFTPFAIMARGEFLSAAFRSLLGRDPDPTGIATYEPYAGSIAGRAYVLFALARSEEAASRGLKIEAFSLVAQAYRWAKRLPVARRLLEGMVQRLWGPRYELLNEFRRQQQPLLSQLHRQQHELELLRDVADQHADSIDVHLSQLEADESSLRLVQKRMDTLETSLPAAIKAGGSVDAEQLEAMGDSSRKLADYYLAFEDACRGERDDIKAGLQRYLPAIESRRGLPIVDLGCGRGEWLELLNDNGHETLGVDFNPAMVEYCESLGLNATQGDLIDWVSEQKDHSFVGVSFFHVAEHLPFEKLYELMQQTFRILRPGGFVLMETPNPENVLVGSHTFYHDPTHRNPLTPTAMTFLAEFHGFDQIEIIRSNPYPASARVEGDDAVTARVNGHFCGPQDFALIANKP